MADPPSAALASHWARDARLRVTLHHPADDRASWATYLDGLVETYRRWSIDGIVDRARLERNPATLVWLLHDEEGSCVGGVRAEGPFAGVHDYAGVAEMHTSPDLDRLEARLGRALPGGVVEFKGSWSRGPGRGAVLARCFQHTLWWLSARHAFCVCAAHARSAWESVGGVRLDEIAPAVYPDDRYRSVVLFWGDDHGDHVDPSQERLIACERRYLTPARSRVHEGPPVTSWHPELLLDQSSRFDELVAAGAAVLDHRAACRAELSDLLPPVGEHVDNEPSHWVHYPWRNLLVGLLGPEAHWRLRTDRNRYKIDDDALARVRDRAVGVVGLSVGSAAGFTLAQEGLCGRLRIADFDQLELTNLNRLSGSVADLGVAKTHLLARRIAELDPYLPLEIYDDGLTPHNVDSFLAGLDVVIEECDSIDIKLLVRRSAANAGVPVIMETSDRGLLDVERFDTEPHRPPFHGLVGALDPTDLQDLSTDDKVPHVLSILEADQLSATMAASMIEIDATARTWPQLASDVALGSSLVATTVRTLFTDPERLDSGRLRVDLGELLSGLEQPTIAQPVELEPASVSHPSLPDEFGPAVLAAASLAPSGGNMQPWRFELTAESFEIEARPEAAVGMDIELRGSAVACGAALANALTVISANGRVGNPAMPIVTTLDLDRPHLVGCIPLGRGGLKEWEELLPFVHRRTSNRQLGPPVPLTDTELATLEEATSAGGGRLHYLPPDRIGEIAGYWAHSDRIRYLTPRLHWEMMSELRRPGVDSLTEGLDERTLELTMSDRAKLSILRRSDVMSELARWSGGSRLGEDTRKRLGASSGLLLVTRSGDSRADYVHGGVALQRAWLVATKLGLSLHPMSPVFGYARSIDDFRGVLDPVHASTLHEMSQKAYAAIGLSENEVFILACRVHRGPAPTAVSRRRSVVRAPIATPTDQAVH